VININNNFLLEDEKKVSREYLDSGYIIRNIENIVIRDYCSKKRFQYLLSASEYAMVNSTFVLKQIINELTSIDGIVAYSVFQMPEDDLQRRDFFKKILLLNH